MTQESLDAQTLNALVSTPVSIGQCRRLPRLLTYRLSLLVIASTEAGQISDDVVYLCTLAGRLSVVEH
jgi:hypothetical protein